MTTALFVTLAFFTAIQFLAACSKEISVGIRFVNIAFGAWLLVCTLYQGGFIHV